MVVVFLADGFEEIEALATVDILRRADLNVTTAGVGTAMPTGAHNMKISADLVAEDLQLDTIDAMVLPGGMPGTVNLEQSPAVQEAIAYAMEKHLPIAAICAAPSILGHLGHLHGVRATCYPGFESELEGAVLCDGVVTDGSITTASGAGVAVDFALELVRVLVSEDVAESIRRGIQCR